LKPDNNRVGRNADRASKLVLGHFDVHRQANRPNNLCACDNYPGSRGEIHAWASQTSFEASCWAYWLFCARAGDTGIGPTGFNNESEGVMAAMLFSKQRASELMNTLHLGEPIKPAGKSWDDDELLQVAAAALVAITVRTVMRTSEQPLEQQEAKAQARYDDLFAAAEFFADLTAAVVQKRYDNQFAPLVRVELVRNRDQRAIRVVSGSKASDN
jgi:hypothetical protein